jgi:membrane associated rhomboid family serine protease/Tfp pilus assembly protein PilF
MKRRTKSTDSKQNEAHMGTSDSQVISTSSESAIATNDRISATVILTATSIVVFVAMFVYGAYANGMDATVAASFDVEHLECWGANYGPYTLGGQYWRVITSLFLHINIFHLAWNMLFLWMLGRQFERLVGRAETLAIYLLTGVGGSLLSLWWHPLTVSAGASSAVCGFAGALISLLALAGLDISQRNRRSILLWAALFTPVCFVSGLRSKEVDNAAHLGGLVTGLIIGALLAWILRSKPAGRFTRQWQLLAFSLVVLITLFVGLVRFRGDLAELYRGKLALDRNDPAAIAHFQEFVAHSPRVLIGHLDLGNAYYHFQRYREAAEEFRSALEIEPDNAAAQHNLGLVYCYYLNRPEDAVPLLRESIPHLGQTSDNYFDFGNALRKAGNLQEAEKTARTAIALDPKSGRNHELLATILDQLGKTDQAATEHKLAEQLRSLK